MQCHATLEPTHLAHVRISEEAAEVPEGGPARFRRTVFQVALRILGDRQEAEDLTQEVLLQLCEASASLRPGSDESAWVYTVTVNRCRDVLRSHWFRARGRTVPVEGLRHEDHRPTPDVALERTRREQKLQAALQDLPQAYREVLVLKDLEGQPYRRICQVLGLPETNLKSRVIRARRALAEALAKRGAL